MMAGAVRGSETSSASSSPCRPADRLRIERVDHGVELASYDLDHGVGVNGLRHVVDEVDEHAQPDDRLNHREGDRNAGDERDLPALHTREHHEAVQVDPDKRAEHDLIAGVPQERPKQSRAELRRRQLQRHDRHREHDTADRDHRPCDRRQDDPRGGGTSREDQRDLVEPRARSVAVEGRRCDTERQCAERHQPGDEPEAAMEAIPNLAQ
jgi:hypothetical protein